MSLLRTTAILLFTGALFSHGTGLHAQQTREQLAARLPSSNLSGGEVQATRSQLLAAPGFARARVPHNPGAPDATAVGEATCISCHQLEADHFTHTLHSLGLHAANQADASVPVCEACHGPGSRHAQAPFEKGTIIAFTKAGGTPIEVQTATCLNCHKGGPRDHWSGSVHQRNGLSCSDCHNPMANFSGEGFMARNSISDTCAQCHKDVRVQFKLAHAAAGRADELRRLPQSAWLDHQPVAQDQHGQRDLLPMPCRKARAIPVRTRARA